MKTNTYHSINVALDTTYIKQDDEIITITPKMQKESVTAAIALSNNYKISIADQKEIINTNFQEDYDFIRTTLKELMTAGVNALETATELAQTTESPRAFEVCTTIITTISGLGKELTNLHKDAIKMASDDVSKNGDIVADTVNNVQNNYYSPTPKELQKVLDEVIEVEYDDSDLE